MRRANRSFPRTRGLQADVRAKTDDGRPLDSDARRILEQSFDVDLSAIQVHDTPRADGLARSLRADAFAAGPHVFFRAGAYQPRTEPGLWLLAHEVSHSIQQARGAVSQSTPAHVSENLADRAADRVLAGQPAGSSGNLETVDPLSADGPLVIQRHGSWEHRLLGDARSEDLNSITQRASTVRNY